jgi:hypothetical protein
MLLHIVFKHTKLEQHHEAIGKLEHEIDTVQFNYETQSFLLSYNMEFIARHFIT